MGLVQNANGKSHPRPKKPVSLTKLCRIFGSTQPLRTKFFGSSPERPRVLKFLKIELKSDLKIINQDDYAKGDVVVSDKILKQT